MALSKRLRYEILRRDDHKCRYCGADATDAKLTVDHVVPVALGGSDEPDNLVTACAHCNAGKSSSAPDQPIVENVADDALRWAAALKRAAELEEAKRDRIQPILDAVDEAWSVWTYTPEPLWQKPEDPPPEPQPMPRPGDWKQSVKKFIAGGLTEADLIDAIEITMNAKRVKNYKLWRYFCGVCYRRLDARQEVARALLEAEQEGE